MVETVALQCPNCGGGLKDGSGQCEYCGTSCLINNEGKIAGIGGVVCRNCGSTNGHEDAYCVGCGVKIRTSCRNCGRSIVNRNIKCPYCGTVHHAEAEDPLGETNDKELQAVTTLRDRENFADAEKLFFKMESHWHDHPRFYIEWIRNYMLWGMSFDSKRSMHNFSTLYRNKAFELHKFFTDKFPGAPGSKELSDFLNGNKAIRQESPEKAGCFIATAIYGDPLCPEVEALRRWREEHLRNKLFGGCVIGLYNTVGPCLAEFVKRHGRLKKPFRAFFETLIKKQNRRSNHG